MKYKLKRIKPDAFYIFYGWWDIRFLSLIILTSSFCFVSGLLIERAEGNRKKQKIINTINILLNIGILGTFKYFDFFSTNIETALHSLGFEPDWITLDILLPVGISFYTLQALSYSIDVYQKKISACHDPIAFFAFVSFFPQLVAGPIERATNLLPQFYKRRTFDYSKAADKTKGTGQYDQRKKTYIPPAIKDIACCYDKEVLPFQMLVC